VLQNILKHRHKGLGQRLLANCVKQKIIYLLILIFLSNCNSVSGTSDGVKKMSEGASILGEGVLKAGEGIVTISQGLVPIGDGMYKDAVDLGRFLLRD